MNSTNNPSLSLEQQRLIRQAQQTVRAHAAEIDAAVDAARTVDEHADQLDAAAKTARTVRRHPATIRTATKARNKAFTPVRQTVDALSGLRAALDMSMAPALRPMQETARRAVPKFDEIKPLVQSSHSSLPLSMQVSKLVVDTPDLSSMLPKSITSPAFIVPSMSIAPDLTSNAMSMVRSVSAPIWNPEQFGIAGLKPAFSTNALDAMRMATSWQSVLPNIDLSVFGRVHDVAASLAGLNRSVADALGSLGSLRSTLGTLLDDWQTLAGFGHRLARRGVRAALEARAAVLNNDVPAVKAFARTWLGIKKITTDVLDTVVEVLLEWAGGWDVDAIEHLRSLYNTRRRRHEFQFLGETKIQGRQIDSLNRLVGNPDGDVVELGALLPAPEVDFGASTITNPRVLGFLALLDPVEQEITLARYSTHDKSITWAQAAEDCGYPAEKGNSVRRKVTRLKKQLTTQTS